MSAAYQAPDCPTARAARRLAILLAVTTAHGCAPAEPRGVGTNTPAEARPEVPAAAPAPVAATAEQPVADAGAVVVAASGASLEPATQSGPAPADAGADHAAGASSPSPAGAPAGMALVPAGPFLMGADEGGEPDEHPAHEVMLDAYWLDVTEVTNEGYAECVQAGVCRPKDLRTGVFKRPRQPVTAVSWDDASTYCAWRGKRLPTEAEFEKAVRGPDGRRFPWGNEPPTLERTVALGQPGPDDVGSRPAGRGPYGHDDLAGNVWEWVADLYDPYAYQRPGAPRGVHGSCEEILAALAQIERQGKKGYTGTNPISTCERSIRGGAYNYPAEGLRSSNRIHHPGTWRLRMTGMRCAKSMP